MSEEISSTKHPWRKVLCSLFLFIFTTSCSTHRSLPEKYLIAVKNEDLEGAFELLCNNRLINNEIPLKYTESWEVVDTEVETIADVEILTTFVKVSEQGAAEFGLGPELYRFSEINAEDMSTLIADSNEYWANQGASERDLEVFDPKRYKSSGRCFSIISIENNRRN